MKILNAHVLVEIELRSFVNGLEAATLAVAASAPSVALRLAGKKIGHRWTFPTVGKIHGHEKPDDLIYQV